MANINASELNTLQTRINNERSRRGLSPVTFTDGIHSAGDIIKATHFNELRTYTQSLNTLGSQTFNWSDTISVGGSISNALTQIDNFVSTLEVEALASWNTISYNHNIYDGTATLSRYAIPQAAWASGKVRWKSSYTLTVPQGGVLNFARVLQLANNLTPTTASYGGGWHNLVANIHQGASNGDLFGLGQMSSTATIVQPMIGAWGDNIQSPDETPYTSLNGKGSQSTNNGRFNTENGTISHSDPSLWYQGVANNWYYNSRAFSSSYPSLLLFGSVNSGSLVHSLVTIQAYY